MYQFNIFYCVPAHPTHYKCKSCISERTLLDSETVTPLDTANCHLDHGCHSVCEPDVHL